ncbi:MAG: DUF4314 domain-containing protein [Eubacterium sp.]|nr:DUF4314 domain-containing protein [Eubacterium sp.]
MGTDVERIREQYPQGTKLRLLKDLDDPYAPKRAGDVMTVSHVDDAGQVHGTWKSGGSLALLYGVDAFDVISRP